MLGRGGRPVRGAMGWGCRGDGGQGEYWGGGSTGERGGMLGVQGATEGRVNTGARGSTSERVSRVGYSHTGGYRGQDEYWGSGSTGERDDGAAEGSVNTWIRLVFSKRQV